MAMNTRFVAFVSHSGTTDSTFMVCTLVDRAQVESTRHALQLHGRTVGRASTRFADLSPSQQEASMALFGGMRVLGAVVLRTDRDPGEGEADARARVLEAAARYAREQAADHLVIDDALGQPEHDGEIIDRATADDPLSHEHATLDDDPMLWIPEAVAYVVAHTEPTMDEVPGWLLTGMIVV